MLNIKKAILKFIELCGGFYLLRWCNRNTPLILMYHRITDEPYAVGLPPAEFKKQIAYLAERFRIVPMATMLHELNTNTLKPFTLSITFDDGHSDFFQYAWPILKQYKQPASLYVTTGFIDGTHWLWPDLLKYILINSSKTILTIGAVGPISTEKRELNNSWHKLGDYCLTLITHERTEFLNNLAMQADVTVPESACHPFAAVSWDELRQMQAEGLDVGSHTVSHPILSKLDDNGVLKELTDSANTIKRNLGTTPQGLCYPNGRLIDINEKVLVYAKTAGYQYGLLGRNIPMQKDQPYLIGRLAANTNFDYFKWTLANRQKVQDQNYIN